VSLLRRLGNPLGSEAAAFRWLIAITVLVAALAAIVLIARALL
jgi:hypothetical protein